jgi:TetR/AcrR family transcriptional repressor of lmrAB and yxaGH operons
MLETTIELLRAHGLSGTGINDIIRQSGAPKGSVYHFFPDGKLQIASEALTVYTARVQDFIQQALSGAERPSDKVLALFDAFAKRVEESSFRRSCAAGAVSLDLDEALESLRQVAASAFACWSATIAAHFEFGDAAQKRSFAGFVLTAIEGAYVRSRAEHSGQPFRDAGHWLSQLVPPPGQGALPVHQPVSGLRRNKAVGAAVPVRTQPRGRRG